MSNASTPVADVEVDLRAVFRALRRALPWLVIIGLIAAAATYALLSLSDPTYRAETSILIDTGESELAALANAPRDVTAVDQEGIASQVQLIRSRDIATAVIDRLELATNPEFDPAQKQPGPLDSILEKIGLGGEPSTAPVEEVVLGAFLQRLEVTAIAATRVISIAFTSTDPKLAADVVNAVSAEYIAFLRAAQRNSTVDATGWLQSEIATLTSRVQQSEAAVAAFRNANNLFVGQNNLTVIQAEYAARSAELSTVTADRVAAEMRVNQLRADLDGGGALNAPEILASPLIQNLRAQEVTLRAQIAEASATYLPSHPRIRELNAQLTDLTNAIRTEAQKVLASLESQAALARSREADLSAEIDRLRTAVANANEAEVELRALQRTADTESATLETYLARYNEALARQNADLLPVNAQVISPASAPLEAVFPKKLPMSLAALVIVLMLGAAIVLVRELASGRSTRPVAPRSAPPAVPQAMPMYTPAPVRWAAPVDEAPRMMPRERHLTALMTDQAERSLAAISKRIESQGARRVVAMMAESTADIGRPLAAVALARSLARLGARVLLVDLHRDDADPIAMGETSDLPGFGDLLAGDVSFAQVIFRDRSSTAHFIPTGHRSIDALLDERLSTLLDALDHTYDHVVYDCDPDMVSVLCPNAATVVLVSEVGPGDPRTVRAYEAVKAISDADILLLVTEPERSTLVGPGEPLPEAVDAVAEALEDRPARSRRVAGAA